MRILIIKPTGLDHQARPVLFEREIMTGLTLPYLAALIPGKHEVRLVEDSVTPVKTDADVDLALISVMTPHAERGYQIGDAFRARGIPVAMGGGHASFFIEETLAHADAVVVGEAEQVMDRLLEDAETGRLGGVYRSDEYHDLRGLPAPRYDLVNFRNYICRAYPVWSMRGCPNNCAYCMVSSVYGRKNRRRPIGDVLRDMKRTGPFMVMVDDNLSADKEYARELFRGMKALNKVWIGQSDISIAQDESLMKAARESGCVGLYVGIESLSPEAIQESNKQFNLEMEYAKAVKIFQRHDIALMASMIVGFDSDQKESRKHLLRFLQENRVPYLFLYILTPIPGSRLYERLEETGRIRTRRFSFYNGTNAVFEPNNFSVEELENDYWDTLRAFYGAKNILRRTGFPPRMTILISNFIIGTKVRQGIHPLMGIRRVHFPDLFAWLGMFFVANPVVRKASALLRRLEFRQ